MNTTNITTEKDCRIKSNEITKYFIDNFNLIENLLIEKFPSNFINFVFFNFIFQF